MPFRIDEFRANLALGGARPTLFQVNIFNPVNGVANIKMPFLVRTAELPGSTLGLIQLPYFGRYTKYAGDRNFPPWVVRVINDEDFLIRNALEEWSNNIAGLQNPIRAVGSQANIYKSQAQVIQYGKDETPLRQYTFYGIWPADVAPIQLDWASQDQVEEYNVTFQYDYFLINGGTTGDAGGAI